MSAGAAVLNTNLATAVAFLVWVGVGLPDRPQAEPARRRQRHDRRPRGDHPGGRLRQRLGRDRAAASIASVIVYFAMNYLSRVRPFRNVDDTLGVIYTHGFAGLCRRPAGRRLRRPQHGGRST